MAAVRRRSFSVSLYRRFCWPIFAALPLRGSRKPTKLMLLPTRTSQRLLTPPAQPAACHPCLWALTSMCKIQEPRTKLWDCLGVIVAIGRHHDHFVRMRSGRVYWRNRHFLRPFIPLICSSESSSQTTRTASTSSQAEGPRIPCK